ncbi:MAG: hypothetical protein KF858_11135 [Candidatus Sumerlaeia bacterium]|nr:hypothetical protein [Candidatus Sumerlaeia bacterium]
MAKQAPPRVSKAVVAKASSTDIPKAPTGKEARKGTVFAKYKADTRRTPMQQVVFFGVWILVLGGLGLAAYGLFFKPADGRIGERSTPDSVYEAYSNFVRPYVPPSTLSPTQDSVNHWLGFFDSKSRSWFDQNVDKLSFLQNRTRPDDWLDMPRARRRMDAMQFLLVRGPLRGGVVVSQRLDPDGAGASLTVSAGRGNSTVYLRKTGRSWEFQDFMDVITEVNPQIDGVVLPTR